LRLPVIPFRTEAVEPRDSLGYFLESVHWLDASKPPWQLHLPVLSDNWKRARIQEVARSEAGKLAHDMNT
jgi:hypothetical protein